MKTGSGVEVPPRVQRTWALAVVAGFVAGPVGVIAAGAGVPSVVWVPLVGALVLVCLVSGAVSFRLGAEMRRTARRERRRQGYARGEIDWSSSTHQLQMAGLVLLAVAQALGLSSGDVDWFDGVVMTALLVLLGWVGRSAYLRRRRERQQRAGTVDGEVSR